MDIPRGRVGHIGYNYTIAGRLKLAELYAQQGNATISNLERESVL